MKGEQQMAQRKMRIYLKQVVALGGATAYEVKKLVDCTSFDIGQDLPKSEVKRLAQNPQYIVEIT